MADAQNDTSAMWNHIGELHKKHADLAIKVGAGGSGEGMKQLTDVLQQLRCVATNALIM